MNKVISTIKGFGKARYVILAVGALAFIAIGVSSGAQPAKSDTCTQIAVPQTPAFNVWPLTFDNSVPCADLPMVDAADASATGRNARFSQSQAEHDAGIQANPGDYVTISVYFHNGATPDPSLLAQTTAQNVQIASSYNAGAATTHTFSASISTSNGAGASSSDPARGGDITVNSSVPTTIQYVPGSTSMSGGSGQRSLPDGIANGSIGLGSIMACWNYSGTVQYQVQIVAVPTPPVTPTGTITAAPNPIQVCTGTTGVTTLSSSANVPYDIYLSQAGSTATGVNGQLVNSHPGDGSTHTDTSGNWVTNGMTFYLVDHATGATLAQVTVNLTTSGCTVTPPPATCTVSNTPSVTGQQGYNPTTNAYTSQVYPNEYLVLYSTGGNFGSSPTVSGLPAGASESYGGANQINIQLGSYTGSYSITVNGANGCTGTATGTIVPVAVVTTCSAANSPTVTGVGGYNSTTKVYSTQIYPNSYMVIYGSNFGSAPTVSGLPTGATVSYVSSTQINVLLGSYTGSFSATVTNSSACTGVASGTIAAATVTTVTPTGTISVAPVQVCTGSTGTTTVTSSANVPYAIYTVVPYSNGTNLLATHPGDSQQHTDQTNSYVSNGTVFYLVGTASGAALSQTTATTTTSGCTVTPPPSTYAQLQINKLVQDQNYATSYAKSVNAYPNDVIKFQITVVNVGTAAATNVYVADPLPAGLSYLSGTTTVDGSTVSDITAGNVSLGTMAPNQQRIVVFNTTVSNLSTSGNTIQNTATASASNAYSVQSSASVFVQTTGTVNLTQSKSAYNNSLGVNATTAAAQPGNTITYTLTVANTGTVQAAGYVVSDDLSNVLQFASLLSANGGSLNGSVISWPQATIAPGSSVADTFQVRVNSNTNFNGSQQMVNTFGNTVVIPLAGIQPIYVQAQPVQPIYVQQQPQQVYIQPQQPLLQIQQPVQQPQVLGATFVAPKTGADAETAYAFAGLVTTATAAIRKRSWLTKLFKK